MGGNRSVNHEALASTTAEISKANITDRDAIYQELFNRGLTTKTGNFVKFIECRLSNFGWQAYAGEVAGKNAHMIFWLSPECKKPEAATYCAARNVNFEELFLYAPSMGIALYSHGRCIRGKRKTDPARKSSRIRCEWSKTSGEIRAADRPVNPEELTPAQIACQDLANFFLKWRDWVRANYSQIAKGAS